MDQTPTTQPPADLCFDDGNEDTLAYGFCGRRNGKTPDRSEVTCTPCLFLLARTTGPRCGKPIGVSHQPCTLNAGHKEGCALAVVSTLHGPCAVPECTSDAYLPHDFHIAEWQPQGVTMARQTTVCPACGVDVEPGALPAHLLGDLLECQHEDTVTAKMGEHDVETCEECGAFRAPAPHVTAGKWTLPPLVHWLTEAMSAALPLDGE